MTSRMLGLLAVFVMVCLPTGNALAQAADGQKDLAAVGAKLSNPLSDVWALFTEFDSTWSEGDWSSGSHRSGGAMVFQPIMPIPLTANSKLLTRPTVPIVFAQDVPSGLRYKLTPGSTDASVILRPDGTTQMKNRRGLGDVALPVLYTRNPEPGQTWGFAYGPTFTFPTATSDELGHDTWEIGPALAVTYKTPSFTGAVLGQYWWNYAEEGSDTADTSHGSILYSAWWNLPNAWQVGFNPTITYNNEAPSDNEWNVPIGIGVAKTLRVGKTPVKVQFSIEKSVVRQDGFGPDWKFRLNIIPVIPGLVQNPLFN